MFGFGKKVERKAHEITPEHIKHISSKLKYYLSRHSGYTEASQTYGDSLYYVSSNDLNILADQLKGVQSSLPQGDFLTPHIEALTDFSRLIDDIYSHIGFEVVTDKADPVIKE